MDRHTTIFPLPPDGVQAIQQALQAVRWTGKPCLVFRNRTGRYGYTHYGYGLPGYREALEAEGGQIVATFTPDLGRAR